MPTNSNIIKISELERINLKISKESRDNEEVFTAIKKPNSLLSIHFQTINKNVINIPQRIQASQTITKGANGSVNIL